MSDFKKLQKEWYAKLKESGFKDIENPDDQDAPLNSIEGSSEFSKRIARWSKDLRREYFRDAESFLETGFFDSQKEEMIWRLHSTGISIRKTIRFLSEAGFKKPLSFWYVREVIVKYKQRMRFR